MGPSIGRRCPCQPRSRTRLAVSQTGFRRCRMCSGCVEVGMDGRSGARTRNRSPVSKGIPGHVIHPLIVASATPGVPPVQPVGHSSAGRRTRSHDLRPDGSRCRRPGNARRRDGVDSPGPGRHQDFQRQPGRRRINHARGNGFDSGARERRHLRIVSAVVVLAVVDDLGIRVVSRIAISRIGHCRIFLSRIVDRFFDGPLIADIAARNRSGVIEPRCRRPDATHDAQRGSLRIGPCPGRAAAGENGCAAG